MKMKEFLNYADQAVEEKPLYLFDYAFTSKGLDAQVSGYHDNDRLFEHFTTALYARHPHLRRSPPARDSNIFTRGAFSFDWSLS